METPNNPTTNDADALGRPATASYALAWHQACETAAVLLGIEAGLSAREFVEAVGDTVYLHEIQEDKPSTVLAGLGEWHTADEPPMARHESQSDEVLAWAPGLFPDFTPATYDHRSETWYCCARNRPVRVSYWQQVFAPEGA